MLTLSAAAHGHLYLAFNPAIAAPHAATWGEFKVDVAMEFGLSHTSRVSGY
jgi:hypothetical protein